MKKLLLIGGLTTVLLAGCTYNSDTGQEINSELVDIGNLGENYDLIKDKSTGCVYIQEGVAHSYPLTPYYGEDGQVVGCGKQDLDNSKYN